jgi:sec-independent protein translocase protein TatC
MQQNEATRAPLMAHLVELRTRLIYAALGWMAFAGLGCYYAEEIYQFLAAPLLASGAGGTARHLIYTGLSEPFMVYMKLGLDAGFAAAFPWIALQIYLFMAPGLYAREKQILVPYLISTQLLFVAGAALAYYVAMPAAWQFFLSFEKLPGSGAAPLLLEARISEYIGLVSQFIIAFGLAFQLPVVLVLLVQTGVMGADILVSKRRYAVVILLVLAAIFTPPDVISQLLLFIPLMLLYECSIVICKRIERKNARHKTDP